MAENAPFIILLQQKKGRSKRIALSKSWFEKLLKRLGRCRLRLLLPGMSFYLPARFLFFKASILCLVEVARRKRCTYIREAFDISIGLKTQKL
jgi:hypothetical protein